MKRSIVLFHVLLMTMCLSAQELPFAKGTYGIDYAKRIIIVTGQDRSEVEHLVLGGEAYKLYRSTMPVINIRTDGPIVNTPAVHGVVSVADADDNVIVMDAGIKIRGTSSQQYEKKSYRVELWADESGTVMADTSFLGLRSDDDWNLEAMWTEPLRLRNKVANELWMEMYQLPYLESEPDALPGVRMRYADLFVNDEYIGVYTLTERMDRKQLGLRKYNGTVRGVLYKGNGPGTPSFETLPDFDNAQDVWDNFEWVYPNESDTAIDWRHLYDFVNFVENASDNAFYAQYGAQFDVDNAIDYYIFMNVIGAMDNMSRNTFIARYKKSSAYLYLPWDMDAIIGLDVDGQQNNSVTGLRSNGFFDRLDDDCFGNGFVERLQARYNGLRNGFLTTEHFMNAFRVQYEALVSAGAYVREQEAWPSFSADESELDYMEAWIESRLQYLDEELNVDCGTWETQELSESMGVEVFPNPAKAHVTLRFSQIFDVSLAVYDMTGREVMSRSAVSQVFAVPTTQLRPGVYAFVIHADGRQWVERVVIE